MIFSVPVAVDGVSAVVDFVVDEHAVAAYLGVRAMRNRTARSTISKNLPGGRTSLVIAEVRIASKQRVVSDDPAALSIGAPFSPNKLSKEQ